MKGYSPGKKNSVSRGKMAPKRRKGVRENVNYIGSVRFRWGTSQKKHAWGKENGTQGGPTIQKKVP